MPTTAIQVPVVAARNIQVEASDIQAIVLRPRPKPYRGEYVILRVGDARRVVRDRPEVVGARGERAAAPGVLKVLLSRS